jgi:DNA primase
LRPGQNGSAQKTGGRDLIPLSHLITEWMKLRDDMNAVDDEVSLESLKNHSGVLRLYLRRGNFKKNGQEYVTNCPFHLDKTPSCKLNCKTGGWLFFCHGCQSGGSIIDFVMQSDHLDLGAAIQTIKKELGIGAPSTYKSAHKPDEFTKQKTFATIPLAAYVAVERLLAQSQRAQDWLLKERGISYVTAKQLHIGYRQKIEATDETLKDILDKGWFVFPSIENDRVISIKYRSIVRKAFSRKFGMATALFNSETIDFLDDLYVTAGEWDALVLEQAGFHAVSIGSDTTPVTPEMITKLRLSDRVILAGDSDESGTRAMDKLQEKIPAALRLIWPGVKDAN